MLICPFCAWEPLGFGGAGLGSRGLEGLPGVPLPPVSGSISFCV